MERFQKILDSINDTFSSLDVRVEEMAPVSTWFSYGSNMYAPDFEEKMKRYGSSLSLLNAEKALLTGYLRKLDNNSITRGLAYAVHPVSDATGSSPEVEGILHDIPVADVPAFLRFEGVLNRHYHAKNSGYEIKRAKAKIMNSKTETEILSCFVLIGADTVPEKDRKMKARDGNNGNLILQYIKTAMKGAVDFELDLKPFLDDLSQLKSWLAWI